MFWEAATWAAQEEVQSTYEHDGRWQGGLLGGVRQGQAVPQADGGKDVNGDEHHLTQNHTIPAATGTSLEGSRRLANAAISSNAMTE